MTKTKRRYNERYKSLPGAPTVRLCKLKPLLLGYRVSESERQRRSDRMVAYWARIRKQRAA